MSEQLRTVLSYKRQPVVSPQLLLHESTSLLIPTSKSCIPPPSMSYSFLPLTPPPKRRRSHAENLNVHIPLFRLQMQLPHEIPVTVPYLRHVRYVHCRVHWINVDNCVCCTMICILRFTDLERRLQTEPTMILDHQRLTLFRKVFCTSTETSLPKDTRNTCCSR